MKTIVLFPLRMLGLFFEQDFHGLPYPFQELSQAARALLPGVGIRPDPEGGAPFVVLSDGRQDTDLFHTDAAFGLVRALHLTELIAAFSREVVQATTG